MDSIRTSDLSRLALSYSLEGVTPREELLFKSLVRLLDHLTAQKWIFRPASADYRVDLLVVAEWYPPTAYRQTQATPQPVLSIGKGAARNMCLSWPVQPQQLRAVLDRIGAAAVLQQASGAPFAVEATGGSRHENISNLSNSNSNSNSPQLLFRLRQWPPSQYLAGAGRMRLATLLTGRAMTLRELQLRSALSLSICQTFIADLQKGELLVVAAVPAPPAAPLPVAIPEPHILLNLSSSAVAFAKPGLLARIRAGLGIKSAHNS